MKRALLLLALVFLPVTTALATPPQLTAPNGGEQLTKGAQFTIRWTYTGSTPLKLILRRNGERIGSIVENVAASATSYNWTVGNYIGGTAAAGAGYSIRVRTMDDGTPDDSNATFTIVGASSHPMASKADVATHVLFASITAPAADAVWGRNKPQTITWTKYGSQVPTVRIQLMDPTLTTAVAVIAASTPNAGVFSWQVPATVADGSYRIRVASPDGDRHAESGTFRIAKMVIQESVAQATVDAKRLKIDVTLPPEGKQYTLGNTIDVRWVTDLAGPFHLELVSEDGKTLARSFGEVDGNPAGPNTWTESINTWLGMEPRIDTNWYRVRIRTNSYGSGLSGRIHVARPTEEVVVQLQPTVRDRHSRRLIDTDYDAQPDGWFEASKPGLARAGGDFRYNKPVNMGDSYWIGFIFRSQVVFPVEQVDLTGRTLKDAWVYLEEMDQKDGSVGMQPAPQPHATIPTARGQRVFALTGPWDGKCIDTPGYQVGEIPWNADTYTVNIKELAQGWLAGTKPNHGLIIGSRWDAFPDWTCFFAVSWYKATLGLQFVQEK
jgi:hypothetical protein